MFACRHIGQVLEKRLGAFAFVQPALRAKLGGDIVAAVNVCLFSKPEIAAGEMVEFGGGPVARSLQGLGLQLGRYLSVCISSGHLRPGTYAGYVF